MNRKRLTAGIALLAVLAAGCAANTGPVNLADVGSAQPPLPGGVLTGKAALPSAAAPTPGCQEPTASAYRPPNPMPAPGHMPATGTLATIQERNHLVVGVDQNTYLFGYRDPKSNTLDGFDIQIARDVAQAIFGDPTKVQFKAITSGQRIPFLQQGQVDMVVRTFTINCAREQQVAFSTVYYQASRKALVRADSTARSIADLAGKRVCATIGSDSLNQGQGTANAVIPVAVNDWSDCLVMLQQGQVDAVITDDTILAGLNAQDANTRILPDVLAPEPYGIAFPKTSTDLVGFVNGVLEQLRANGEWTQTYQRWVGARLGPTPAPPQATYK